MNFIHQSNINIKKKALQEAPFFEKYRIVYLIAEEEGFEPPEV